MSACILVSIRACCCAGGEADNFAMTLSGDGVVIGKLGSGQACWMLGAMCMNLPPWRRGEAGLMHVFCVILDMVGTDVQPYLELVSDELAFLGSEGFQVCIHLRNHLFLGFLTCKH
jgi:hypothetical protein